MNTSNESPKPKTKVCPACNGTRIGPGPGYSVCKVCNGTGLVPAKNKGAKP